MKILYVGKFREPAHIGDFRPVITAYGQLLNPHCEAGEELHLAFLPSEIDRPCANLITWQAATFIRGYDTLVPRLTLNRFIHRDNGSTAYPVISPNFAPYCAYEEVIDRGLLILNAGEDATKCIPFQVFDMDPYEFLRGMNGE